MNSNSMGKIVVKLFVAAVVAVVLLVVVVLPAEYGKDFTGLGEKMGLTALASDHSSSAQPYDRVLEFNVEEYDVTAERIERSINGLVTLEQGPFQSETIVIELEDLGGMEYKFVMDEGMSFVYSWEITNAQGDGVYYDFHGHPKAADVSDYPEGFEMAYSKSEGSKQSGAFRAPFGGLHGFFFMNLEEGPITINLHVSGYFNHHQEVYRVVDGEVLKKVDL